MASSRLDTYVPKPNAFSLVEIVVVIGIIMVILSLLAPAIASARRDARRVSRQSDLRQFHAIVSLYGGDSKELYPEHAALACHRDFLTPLIRTGLISSVTELDRRAMDNPRTPGYPHFVLANCLSLDPQNMIEGQTSDWFSLPTAAIRQSQVLFPSQKGISLVWAADFLPGTPVSWLSEPPIAVPVGWADGAVTFNTWQDCLIEPLHEENVIGQPVLTTWRGVTGRDR